LPKIRSPDAMANTDGRYSVFYTETVASTEAEVTWVLSMKQHFESGDVQATTSSNHNK